MTTIALPHVRRPRIAVLGAGHVGPVIAGVAIEAGYPVSIAASGAPEQIEMIAQYSRQGPSHAGRLRLSARQTWWCWRSRCTSSRRWTLPGWTASSWSTR